MLEWVDGHKGLWFWRGVGSSLCVHATDKIWGNQSQSGNGMWLGPSLASCIAWGGGSINRGEGREPWGQTMGASPSAATSETPLTSWGLGFIACKMGT